MGTLTVGTIYDVLLYAQERPGSSVNEGKLLDLARGSGGWELPSIGYFVFLSETGLGFLDVRDGVAYITEAGRNFMEKVDSGESERNKEIDTK